jgi:hypothetical protein
VNALIGSRKIATAVFVTITVALLILDVTNEVEATVLGRIWICVALVFVAAVILLGGKK